ncbi:MAG: YhbY family RNA-binding protein [Candidatus Methanomethylophilaceae archaeon]|jgi:RNA-binding protein|nr:YhbY family RNA-binding protein [Candidatus Methanomethylophilaceae archaeon]MBO7204854.1 YhbY family RNA-binding protein [Candidatus Methanomethylophilaceae archaeon]MBR7124131.1 YhbY family RNA-binding protein [Candidatus Methanomethylophilaceae archaeon]
MTEKEAKKELMRRALEIGPTVHVGKDGLKDSLYEEIIAQLKKNRLIKVKILTDDSTSEIAETIAEATNSVIVDVRGSVMILTDKRTWTSLSQKKF